MATPTTASSSPQLSSSTVDSRVYQEGIIAGILGAKLWHVIDTPADRPTLDLLLSWNVITWFRGGFAWFGGFVCGIAVLVGFARRYRIYRTDRGFRVTGSPPAGEELEAVLRAAGARNGDEIEVGDEVMELS